MPAPHHGRPHAARCRQAGQGLGYRALEFVRGFLPKSDDLERPQPLDRPHGAPVFGVSAVPPARSLCRPVRGRAPRHAAGIRRTVERARRDLAQPAASAPSSPRPGVRPQEAHPVVEVLVLEPRRWAPNRRTAAVNADSGSVVRWPRSTKVRARSAAAGPRRDREPVDDDPAVVGRDEHVVGVEVVVKDAERAVVEPVETGQAEADAGLGRRWSIPARGGAVAPGAAVRTPRWS